MEIIISSKECDDVLYAYHLDVDSHTGTASLHAFRRLITGSSGIGPFLTFQHISSVKNYEFGYVWPFFGFSWLSLDTNQYLQHYNNNLELIPFRCKHSVNTDL